MNLSLERLKQIEEQSKASGFVDSMPKKVRHWTLDDLARGRMFSQSMIKKVVSNANVRKVQHRYGWNGWTRNRTMRSEVRVPTALYLQPEFQKKYFPENADEHEKAKALEMLKRDYPVFCTHD